MCFSGRSAASWLVFLIASSLSLHHCGLWLDTVRQEQGRILAETDKAERKAVRAQYTRQMRRILLFALLLHIGTLLTLKYAAFFSVNLNHLLEAMHLPALLPVPPLYCRSAFRSTPCRQPGI